MATMPSASLVSSTNSSVNPSSNMTSVEVVNTGNESALNLALQTVEKKVRNLEKRKGKLDGYREDSRQGKELNADQTAAVSKYDEVMQNLEFARDLQTQFKNFVSEEERAKKKEKKKDAAERAKAETSRLATILGQQKVLQILASPKVKEDLKKTMKLNKDQLTDLDEILNLINLDEAEKVTYADHLINLAEAKPRKFGKSTFKQMSDLINLVKKSGFKPAETTTPVAKVENGKNGGMTNGKSEHHEQPAPQQQPQQPPQQVQQPPQQQQQQQPQPPPKQQQQPPMAAPPQAVFPPPPHMNFVPQQQQQQQTQPPTTQPSINFLQESQIDMESPHMDPAVVMVHHTAPPVPATTFNQIFIPPTTLTAALQQHQQHSHFGGHFQQQPQQPPQPQQQAPQQPKPKTPEQPAKVEHVNGTEKEEKIPTKPPGYASITAGVKEIKDEMPPIDDWNDEIAKEEENSDSKEVRNGRGGDRGRGGRGRGNFRGRGGFRGGRGEGRGGRGGGGEHRGERNGDHHRGGYRGGKSEGGFNNREFRSNRGGPRGGRGGQFNNRGGGQQNGYREKAAAAV